MVCFAGKKAKICAVWTSRLKWWPRACEETHQETAQQVGKSPLVRCIHNNSTHQSVLRCATTLTHSAKPSKAVFCEQVCRSPSRGGGWECALRRTHKTDSSLCRLSRHRQDCVRHCDAHNAVWYHADAVPAAVPAVTFLWKVEVRVISKCPI
jgi:hypothetical protein